ncbi:histone acetyltransferase Rtt109p [[Candida] anglica]
MSNSRLLTAILKEFLPKDSNFKLLHLQSRAKECKHLCHYSKKSPTRPSLTLKVKHFITLSDVDGTILMGIEIYIYLSIFSDHTDHHLFISKADTTGLKQLKSIQIKVGEIISSILKYLISKDIQEYTKDVKLNKEVEGEDKDNQVKITNKSDNETVNNLLGAVEKLKTPTINKSFYDSLIGKGGDIDHDKKKESIELPTNLVKIRISLFTRAEQQYLFPDSFKNEFKHNIDGRQLLSWWMKILNEVLESTKTKYTCKLAIPGADSEKDISNFHTSLTKYPNVIWSNGSIFSNEVNTEDLAIYNIPLFPDDPKGRFLEHLVVENRYKTTSTKQFWEELGIRQEFRLGNLVGIIGCDSEILSFNQTNQKDDEIMTLRDYKKVSNIIKSMTYTSIGDVNKMMNLEIPEVLKDLGYNHKIIPITGNKVKVANNLSSTSNSSDKRVPVVNNLNGMIKRRKR